MATVYSSSTLKAIFSTNMPPRLNAMLWRTLIDLGISKYKPTRRGCRGGLMKHCSAISCLSPGDVSPTGNVQHSSYSLNVSGESKGSSHLHLHSSNIHNNTLISLSTTTQLSTSSVSPLKTYYDFPVIYYINPRSIITKIDELEQVIKINNAGVAALCESWLSNNVSEENICLSGFTCYRNDRTERRGGGVAFWIRDDIQHEVLSRRQCDDYESLWLKSRPKKLPREVTSLLLGVIYRPDNTKNAYALAR